MLHTFCEPSRLFLCHSLLPSFFFVSSLLLISLSIFLIAQKNGFLPFNKPSMSTLSMRRAPSFVEVLIAFTIYFAMAFMLLLLMRFVSFFTTIGPLLNILFFMLLAVIEAATLFYYAMQFCQWSKNRFKELFYRNKKEMLSGFYLGLVAWAISLPLTIALSKIVLMILIHFGYEAVDQEVVALAKYALASPILFTFLSFVIVLIVPCFEELLFRGFLQTFLSKVLHRKWSVVCTALIFALFHFNFYHGLANLPLLTVLFVFALFAGLLYERQGSLFASITLHVMFNLTNIVLLVFSF